MITIGGRPAAAVYADALREKMPYTITHTDESFRVLGDESGAVQVYLIDEDRIHARMYGQPFDEGRMHTLCASLAHLPWSLQVTTAILEAATWLDKKTGSAGQKPRHTRTGQKS